MIKGRLIQISDEYDALRAEIEELKLSKVTLSDYKKLMSEYLKLKKQLRELS